MKSDFPTPQGNITIRRARLADAKQIFELRLEALVAHPEAFAADVDMTRANGVQAWKDQLTKDSKDQTGVIIIACVRDQLVGMSGVGRGHWPKTQHSGVVWGVYVNPDWRGLRIAEAMLDECIRWAQEHGFVVLKLGVVTGNQAAIHCYQRSGFTTYGSEPKSICVDGIYYDEYLMARLL